MSTQQMVMCGRLVTVHRDGHMTDVMVDGLLAGYCNGAGSPVNVVIRSAPRQGSRTRAILCPHFRGSDGMVRAVVRAYLST